MKKLDFWARHALMMGYFSQRDEYKLWDPETKRMVVSQDLTCVESEPNDTSENRPIEQRNDPDLIIVEKVANQEQGSE